MADKTQKKIIELPVSIIKVLDECAKEDRRSTKNLIENIVIEYAVIKRETKKSK